MAKSREQYIAENSESNYDQDLVSFSLIDEDVIKRREREGDVSTPFMRTKKYLNIPKDERWNTKQLNSKLLQGILNGDPIPKIAQSFLDVVNNNESAAMRNARTMITQAECGGRQDSYENLAEQGVIQKKVWIATPDDRTRESHIDIDGEEVDIDDTFSNGCAYPADPSGDASEVYNCRCSMRTHIIGIRRPDGTIVEIGAERDDTMHDRQMQEEKERRGIEDTQDNEQGGFVFTPAETREEAERFIEQYVDGDKWAATGVNYAGVDVEVANTANKTLADLQETYNVPKFGGITAPAGNTKEGKMLSGATAAYSPIRDSFYLNRSSLKNMNVANKTLKDEANTIKDMYAHPEKYDFSKMSTAGRRVIENGKESGRATVPQTVEEVIWHEYGHRLEKFIPEDDLTNVYSRMDKFAPKISGYACENKSEYIAESFCCFNNGEKNKIDPVLADVFERMKK